MSAKSYDEGSGSGCSLFARCECICLLCVSREHCSRSNTNKLLKTTVNSNQNYTHILWRLYLEILDRSCLLYLRTFGTHNRIRFEKPYPLYMLDVCFLLFFFQFILTANFSHVCTPLNEYFSVLSILTEKISFFSRWRWWWWWKKNDAPLDCAIHAQKLAQKEARKWARIYNKEMLLNDGVLCSYHLSAWCLCQRQVFFLPLLLSSIAN